MSILVNDYGDWVEITLNRPDKLNSFNDEMHMALRETLETAKRDGKRAILLTGAGRGFCAGQDLGDRDPAKMEGKPDLSKTLTTFYNPLVRLIRSIEAPVICAVNGVAAGAGANVALACDIVLASENAKFIQSFSKVGLSPDAGGSWHLTKLLGEKRAMALALTAEPLSAKTAEEWGLVWKCLPEGDLMNAARTMAESFSVGPTIGYSLIKKSIHAAHANSLDAQLEVEAAHQKTCGETPDYAEGVSAFLNKRPPNFTGKQK